MQTKFMLIIALFFSTAVFSQQSFSTISFNDKKNPGEDAALDLSIIPDEIATAFNLFVRNEGRKQVHLQISHQEYGLLVDTVFDNANYKCRYNFERVEDGRYEITLISGRRRVTKNIEINTVTKRNLVVK